ncbi:MAG: hypothetical protein P8Y00_02515 [Deltaproteobacteria bacterium]
MLKIISKRSCAVSSREYEDPLSDTLILCWTNHEANEQGASSHDHDIADYPKGLKYIIQRVN